MSHFHFQYFLEQYVPFSENKVKEIDNKILSTLLLFPNSKSILEICLTSVYVNKFDFSNIWIIQLLSALKLICTLTVMLKRVHVIFRRRKKTECLVRLKMQLHNDPTVAGVWALLKSCTPKYSEKSSWSVFTFLLHKLFWLFPPFLKFILLSVYWKTSLCFPNSYNRIKFPNSGIIRRYFSKFCRYRYQTQKAETKHWLETLCRKSQPLCWLKNHIYKLIPEYQYVVVPT